MNGMSFQMPIDTDRRRACTQQVKATANNGFQELHALASKIKCNRLEQGRQSRVLMSSRFCATAVRRCEDESEVLSDVSAEVVYR